MKERPILFNGAMVRALLAGTKTQTRRVVKKSESWPMSAVRATMLESRGTAMAVDAQRLTYGPEIKCPYGQPGDRLWVRETWQGPLLQEFEIDADPDWHYASHIHQYQNPAHCEYAADGGPSPEYTDADDVMRQGWRPSIHMPHWASRITLEITSVRVERLQDISEADALAEGIVRQPDGGYGLADTTHYHHTDPSQSYLSLWEAINGEGSVEANPWVWVVEFRSTHPC